MRLLFEKLDQEADPARAMPAMAAIRAQIQRTLHSHVGVDPEAPIDVLSDGIEPLTQVGGQAELDRYAARARDLIGHYEPRLREVTVAVEAVGTKERPARLAVRARLAGQPDDEIVAFPLDLEAR